MFNPEILLITHCYYLEFGDLEKSYSVCYLHQVELRIKEIALETIKCKEFAVLCFLLANQCESEGLLLPAHPLVVTPLSTVRNEK